MNKTEATHGLFSVLDYITSRKISILEKLLVIGFVLAYVISPVDLIPDVPVVGWIDDIGVGVLFVAFCKYRVNNIGVHDAKDDVIDVTPVERPAIAVKSHESSPDDEFFTFSKGNDSSHDGVFAK